jgi:hypothetical protein
MLFSLGTVASHLFSKMLNIRIYSCVWSVTLREERKLQVPGNKVPREVFGHKKDEVK